jgi:hypothetical protein
MLIVDIFDTSSRKKAQLYKNVIVIGFLKGKDDASREIRYQLGGEKMRLFGERGLFLATREDIYAQNQNVIFLAGHDRNVMQASVREKASALRGQIEERNRERVREYLDVAGRDAEAERALSEQAGIRLPVPLGYRVGAIKKSSDGTLGAVEVVANQPTRSVTIFWKELSRLDEVDLEDTAALLALRRQWGVFLDESLQDAFGYQWSREIFRREERPMLAGLYETNEGAYGGPFRTVFVLDGASQRLYGVNWLCYRPSDDKHTWMREVHALAEAFVPRP